MIKLLTILIKLCVRICCKDKNISVNSIKVSKSTNNHLQQRKHLLKQQWSYSMLSNINLKKVKLIIIMYFLKIHPFPMINMIRMFKLLI
jgi:chemotaxis regulatin CheY-phosphate phosphatase CheZ